MLHLHITIAPILALKYLGTALESSAYILPSNLATIRPTRKIRLPRPRLTDKKKTCYLSYCTHRMFLLRKPIFERPLGRASWRLFGTTHCWNAEANHAAACRRQKKLTSLCPHLIGSVSPDYRSSKRHWAAHLSEQTGHNATKVHGTVSALKSACGDPSPAHYLGTALKSTGYILLPSLATI